MEAVSGDEERDRDALSLSQVKSWDARSQYVALDSYFRVDAHSLVDMESALIDEAG